MSRERQGWFLASLIALLVALARSSEPLLLQDSDTRVLLEHLRERNAPFSWFAGDWPLFNHFYRPVTTLTFEFDRLVHDRSAIGFAWTNALLCAGCTLALYWLFRELTSRISLSLLATALFAAWQLDYGTKLVEWAVPLAYASSALGFITLLLRREGRTIRKLSAVLAASLGLWFGATQLAGAAPLYQRMMAWPPGRTASVMTLFVLVSLACTARFARGGRSRPEPTYSPLSPPATRTARIEARAAGPVWMLGGLIFGALALGSYEQAVMLPVLTVGVALGSRLLFGPARKPLGFWFAAFWALLAGYLLLRYALVPSAISGYQAQQFRHGPGVFLSLAAYLFPTSQEMLAYTGLSGFESWPIVIGPSLGVAANVAAYGIVWRSSWRNYALLGLVLSFLAFLPMAWLKPFDHYHYLPMALRSLFVISLIAGCGTALVTAAGRPTIQAPPRRDPAPGSLPHP